VRPPRTAYILLWFPKPSETFIFREVTCLRDMGLPLKVYTLYGQCTRWLSREMKSVSVQVERLGIPFLLRGPKDLLYWWGKDPLGTARLARDFLARPWHGLEKTGESLWAFLCAFCLARRFQDEGIEHIHAPWASGPATAAWIASRLTGIPFSFTARAWDIYPPDSVLVDKCRDATLVRSETGFNIQYLAGIVGEHVGKVRLTYNGVPLRTVGEAPVPMRPPYALLALGRHVETKGYDYLLRACRDLKDSGVLFRLTLAGDGPCRKELERLARSLALADQIDFPGFVPYDGIMDLFRSTDIFIMPSVVVRRGSRAGDRDGIPTVIMEALSHRVPVIATAVSGIPELIEDGVTGLLVQERDSAALARAIVRFTSDRAGAVEMAERGRARVRERFDPEKNYGKVMDLYLHHFPRHTIP
jgi:glycosyltransferase involved in cell wall biosynthesis